MTAPTSSAADQLAALDAQHRLLPGTMAIRHLVHDVRFRQVGPLGWAAQPLNAIDIVDATGIRWPLAGAGETPEAAMADLWDKASTWLLEVCPPGGGEPFLTRWDSERGWSTP